MKFRLVLSIPAKLYAYYDVEGDSLEAIEKRFADRDQLDALISDIPAIEEISEPETEAYAWELEEIGPGTE